MIRVPNMPMLQVWESIIIKYNLKQSLPKIVPHMIPLMHLLEDVIGKQIQQTSQVHHLS